MEERNSMEKNMRVDTAITYNEGGYVSKMVKLLALVVVIALPALVMAQTAPASTPGEQPYKNGDIVKDYGTVTATFEKADISIAGFTLARKVISDPTDTTLYYKEGNQAFWTWQEGYVVTAPAEAKSLGFFTYRPPVVPAPGPAPKGKIYKAIPPTVVKPTPTGWKRGVESVRSK
jgi:hypothetical protein